ncbi:MAG: hypothetical protein QOF17_155 [Solirubrobacteraceae bacterium]|nr:hypothetical protein [Solirubrobacteraceae bacterium]
MQGVRSPRNLAIAAAAVAVLAAAGPLAAAPAWACDAGKRLAAHRGHAHGHGRPPLAIGDSVMLGAADALARAGFEVDAHGCRQMAAGLDLMRARARAGRLPHTVILALGTNWVITRADIRRALAIAGPARVLVLVTPRESGGGSGRDAEVIRDAGRRHPDRIRVADWVRFAAGHGSWFSSADGIHLGPAGAAGMVRLLRPYLRLERPPCP